MAADFFRAELLGKEKARNFFPAFSCFERLSLHFVAKVIMKTMELVSSSFSIIVIFTIYH